MSQTTTVKPANTLSSQAPIDARSVAYVPLGESTPIEISIAAVRNTLAVRSKSGREPGVPDIVKFLMLCRSRKLNPFVGDCYLVPYESSKDGSITWQLIVSVQGLRKRAEASPNFEGLEAGVIVQAKDGTVTERQGTLVIGDEKLVGAWATCYRKDRQIPEKRTVSRAAFDTGLSRWAKDPAGMLVKCAEAAALRASFPSDLAALHLANEFNQHGQHTTPATADHIIGDLQLDVAEADPPHADTDLLQAPPSTSPSAPTREELADSQLWARD